MWNWKGEQGRPKNLVDFLVDLLGVRYRTFRRCVRCYLELPSIPASASREVLHKARVLGEVFTQLKTLQGRNPNLMNISS